MPFSNCPRKMAWLTARSLRYRVSRISLSPHLFCFYFLVGFAGHHPVICASDRQLFPLADAVAECERLFLVLETAFFFAVVGVDCRQIIVGASEIRIQFHGALKRRNSS